jgi:hypothetical protein
MCPKCSLKLSPANMKYKSSSPSQQNPNTHSTIFMRISCNPLCYTTKCTETPSTTYVFHPLQYSYLIPVQLSNHSVHRNACNDNQQQPQALWTGWHTGEGGGRDDSSMQTERRLVHCHHQYPVSVCCCMTFQVLLKKDLQNVQFTLKTGHEDRQWTSSIAQHSL